VDASGALAEFLRAPSVSAAQEHRCNLVNTWGVTMKLNAVFQKVPEGYIGFVEELPGVNTQGDTLEEARENLTEAVTLVLEANRALAEESLRGKVVIREQLIVA
jgi:predicted RNase H-like HicB family nuclease